MSTNRQSSAKHASLAPTILVVFGPTGDLMARKVVPSLYYLREKGQLPEQLRVVGFGRREWDDDDLRAHVRAILAERAAHADPADIEEFLGHFEYQRGEFHDPEAYKETQRHLSRIQTEWGVCANKLFYLAVPPENYETIFRNLASGGLTIECSDLTGLDARARREALRRRPRHRARTRHAARQPLPRGADLPDRPLPRQGDAPGHHELPLHQQPVRVRVEPHARSSRSTSRCSSQSAPRSAARSTTPSARCATSGRTTCCRCSRWSTMEQPALGEAQTTSERPGRRSSSR